jgi:hypothetical protein
MGWCVYGCGTRSAKGSRIMKRRLVSTNDGCCVSFRFENESSKLDYDCVTVRKLRPSSSMRASQDLSNLRDRGHRGR